MKRQLKQSLIDERRSNRESSNRWKQSGMTWSGWLSGALRKASPPLSAGTRRGGEGHRKTLFEPLEQRQLLSVNPLSAFTPSGPAAGVVYGQSISEAISSANEVDQFSVDLSADQTISLIADGDTGLQPRIELLAPNGSSLGAGSAAAVSGQATLQGIRTSLTGTYTVAVSGVGGSQGGYGMRVLLNSAVEPEWGGSGANDTASSAQNLGAEFVELGGGVAELATVSGSLPGYSESFESRQLDHRWTTYTPDGTLTDITGVRGAADGDLALLFHWDGYADEMEETQEAIWTVDMSGLDSPVLEFQAAAWREQARGFDGPFEGHYKASGVAISEDGEHWFPVADVDPGEAWTPYTVDLQAEATTAGLNLDGDLQVKFQRWNGGWFGLDNDGLAYDAITIHSTDDNADWYQFSLDDGQIASIGFSAGQLSTATVELFDSSLDLLTASVSMGDGESLISQFPDSTTNAAPDTYYVKVEGRGMEYQLAVLRGADFERSTGNKTVIQDLVSGVPVLGSNFRQRPTEPGPVGPPQGDVYQFEASVGDQLEIRTETPTEKTYFFPQNLDPSIRLRAPDGTVVAENDNGAQDGLNSLLNFTVSESGSYTVEVLSADYSSGEYLLELDGATGPVAPFAIEETTPADGATISDPTAYMVRFSHHVLATSVDASDLTIDGQASAGARLVDGRTVAFTLPPGLSEEVHTVSIAAGAIYDLSGRSVSAMSATFQPDTSSPRLLTSTLSEGQVIGIGTLTVQMQFDEPLLASALDPGDLQLVGVRTGVQELAHFDYDAGTSILDLRFEDLEDDSYTLTLTSGPNAFRDPVGHGLDGGDLVIHFAAQFEDAPLINFEPIGPQGNLAYRKATEGRVADTSDDILLIDLEPQQTVTLLLTTDSSLRGTVQLIRPNGSVAATATASAAGEAVSLTGITTATAGSYRIAIRGADGSTGDYRLETLLNAVSEDAALDEQTAENVDSAFRSLPGGEGERLVLLGELHAIGESFESGEPGEGWWWEDGTVFASTEWGSADGDTALMMNKTRQGAIWEVDISAMTNPVLSFWHASWEGAGNWRENASSSKPKGAVDGIVVSTVIARNPENDQNRIISPARHLWMPPEQEIGEWVHYSIDLIEALEQFDEPYGTELKLYFQQVENEEQSLPDAGRGWDAIVVTSSEALEDWYEFTLHDGQSASVVMADEGLPGDSLVEIYDDAGNLLVAGRTGEDGSVAIDGFRDRTTDGSLDTYRVRVGSMVSSPDWPYSLTVTRDAGFDVEPNDEPTPQPLIAGVPVMGHISGLEGDRDAYQFAVAAGATISASTATPIVGLAGLTNQLDPKFELYAPDGTLVASDDNSGSGSNAALSHVAAAQGVYTLHVIPVAASAGDYLLSFDASSLASIPFEVLHVQRALSGESAVPPLQVTFSDAVSVATLDAADFLVNGVSVESVEPIDDRSVLVHPKVLTSGEWNLEISAGALQDLRGTPVQPFTETLTVSIPDGLLPGGLLDETLFEGDVAQAGQADHWLVQLAQGQTVTVLAEGGPSLPVSLRALAPDGSQVALKNGTAERVVTLAYTAATAGTYTVVVGGVGSASGSYSGRLVVDALVEQETTLGTANNTIETAEILDGVFIDLGEGHGQRAAARGQLPPVQTVIVEEDFESVPYFGDNLPEGWTSFTTQVKSHGPEVSASRHLLLGWNNNSDPCYFEANWPVDLSDVAGPLILSFDFRLSRAGNPAMPFSGSFTGRANASGIAISNDGVTWYPAWNAPVQQDDVWESHSVNLTAVADAAGIALGANTRIRLQQYAVPPEESVSDIHDYDSFMIARPETTEDWYGFSLADGQTASLMADAKSSAQISLYDSQSNLLAHGVDGVNADQFINQFVDTTTDGQADNYYVRISGEGGPYSLVVTRDAALDAEPNRDFPTAQDVTGTDGVLGNLGDQALWALGLTDLEPQGNISQIADFDGPGFTGKSPSGASVAAGPEVAVSVVEKAEGDNFATEGGDLIVYEKATGRQLARHDLSTILNLEDTWDVEYPSIAYDAASGRFFIAAVEYARHENSAFIRIAVSKNSAPTGESDWRSYRYDLTRTLVGSGLSEERSYPSYFELALSNDAVWISGSYSPFSATARDIEPYVGIIALDKNAMLGGEQGAILYERYFAGNHATPMIQDGSNLIQYFAAADAVSGTTLTLYAVSFIGSVSRMQSIFLEVPEYSMADVIDQSDETRGIGPGTCRIRTGTWHEGSLWIAHTVADPVDEGDAVVRWYEFDTNRFPYGVPDLVQSGDIDPGDGVSAFSPAIAVNADGQTGLAYLTAGGSHHVSACFTGRAPSDPAGEMRPSRVLAEGQSSYSPDDTMAMNDVPLAWLNNQQSLVVDPVDDSTFWMLGEYAATLREWGTQIGAFQMGTPGGEDWYAVEVATGETIDLETFTPGDTWLADGQRLDPAIELYAPDGSLVRADQNGASDGRNACLVHVATEGGRYRVRVLAENGSRGEYVLGIQGLAATNSVPEVIGVSPPLDVPYGQLPESITVTFSEPLRPGSVDADDLRIGGQSALAVSMVSANVLRFEVDPTADTGTYTVEIAAGTVTDIAGLGNRGYQTNIDVDASAPRVTELLVNGQPMPAARIFPEEAIEFAIRFDEEMLVFPGAAFSPLGVNADGIELSGQILGQTWKPDRVEYDAEQFVLTIRFDSLTEDIYRLVLVSGDDTFEDVLGNNLDGDGNGIGGDDYAIDFTIDMATGSGLPLSHRTPFGGLVFSGQEPTAVLHETNDWDDYTFYAQAGQTITVMAHAVDSTAGVTIELAGLGASATSPGPGAAAYLAPFQITSDGVVVLRLSASTATQVVLDVYVNSAIEAHDSDREHPIAIDDSKIEAESWQRWAIVGNAAAEDTEDAYTLDLTGWAGRSIDIVLAGDDAPVAADASLTLIGTNGTTILATSSRTPLGDGVLNYDQAILNFIVPADGIYTLRLNAAGAADYTIVVTADAPFDTELRNNADSPRPIEPGSSALGYLSPESPLIFAADWSFDRTLIHTVNAATGKIVNSFPAPTGKLAAVYSINLAFDGSRLYYMAGGVNGDPTVYVLDGRDGAVLDTFQTTETFEHYTSLGLAYLNGRTVSSQTFRVTISPRSTSTTRRPATMSVPFRSPSCWGWAAIMPGACFTASTQSAMKSCESIRIQAPSSRRCLRGGRSTAGHGRHRRRAVRISYERSGRTPSRRRLRHRNDGETPDCKSAPFGQIRNQRARRRRYSSPLHPDQH